MVKQRFLTHFKPWLVAVIKAGGLIVGYQTLDQIRSQLQYAPLDIGDVLKALTTALFALALLCGLWAWGEWCWFKLRRFRKSVASSNELTAITGTCRELDQLRP